MSKNNTPNQEPRGTKRVRLDQEEGNGQAQKKPKGNIEELNNRLFEICKSPNPDIEGLRSLIAEGADVNAIAIDNNWTGYTPLHFAAEFMDNIEVIRTLVASGADINAVAGEHTPLHLAVKYIGNLGVIRILVELGADINAVDKEGHTSLHLAAESGDLDTASILLELGADVSVVDNYTETPLHRAAVNPNNQKVIRIIVESGGDIHAKTRWGETPLHSASFDESNTRTLVELGADVSIVDNSGKTASSCAESPEIKEFLDSGYHIESDALFNDASYNLAEEVAGDSRVYIRYINLLKREGVKDVFALFRAIDENETISENGKEIIHQEIGGLIEDFLMDFASLLHHAEGIEAIAPLSLMIENPVGEGSPGRDALVEYYNQQAAQYGVNFTCDLMSATTEEITPQDQMLLKQGIFRLNAKIIAENAANWYFSNADARKVLGHIVCHDSKILSFDIRQKLQQIDAQYKEFEGNAIMQFVTSKHEQEMEMFKVENQKEIEVLKAQNQRLQSILKQVCDQMDIEFDITPEDNSAMDIEEDIEEEVPIEENPIQEVEEKPLFDWPSSWDDQDFDIVASGDIVQTNLDSVD